MAYHDTIARLGDSDNTLLGKILQRLGGLATFASSDNDLLFKILTSLNGVDLTSEQALFDARYVLKAGDIMTGGLTAPTLTSTGVFTLGTTVKQSAASDGVLLLTNAAATDFSRIQFGGTAATFPAIKRNAASIDLRLADDSAYASLNCDSLAANGTITSTGAVAFGTSVVATIQCTIQDALTTTFLFVNNTNVAGAASLILRNSGIGVNRGWRITSDSGTDQLSITDEGVGIMAMFTSAKNLVLHTVSTIQPASLAKGIVLADGTAASGDPTTASAIWSVAGSLQYRTSAANEGAGQTNNIHNRGAAQAGVGTNYTLTNATAHIVFGTTNADITLPSAGTYLIQANVSVINGATPDDIYDAKLRNSTDGADIGVNKKVSGGPASGRVNIVLCEIVTIATSKTIQLFAFNETGARGTIESTTTDIRYVRLF